MPLDRRTHFLREILYDRREAFEQIITPVAVDQISTSARHRADAFEQIPVSKPILEINELSGDQKSWQDYFRH